MNLTHNSVIYIWFFKDLIFYCDDNIFSNIFITDSVNMYTNYTSDEITLDWMNKLISLIQNTEFIVYLFCGRKYDIKNGILTQFSHNHNIK
jgi:hypothetical protein